MSLNSVQYKVAWKSETTFAHILITHGIQCYFDRQAGSSFSIDTAASSFERKNPFASAKQTKILNVGFEEVSKRAVKTKTTAS